MNRKVWVWVLYDFAGYVLTANFLYLSLWAIVEHHLPEILYSATSAAATMVLFLTAPFLSILVDKTGKRMKIITPLTVANFITAITFGFIGVSTLPWSFQIAAGLFLFFTIQCLHQLILIFYDTLIPDLANPEHYSKISGFGEGFGQLGLIFGLIITYPFVNQTVTLFGSPGRMQVFFPASLIYLLLSFPMLIAIKDQKISSISTHIPDLKETLQRMKSLLKNRAIFYFILGFYFISDAVLTLQVFSAVYLQQVLAFSDQEKVLAGSFTIICLCLGAIVFSKLGDKINLKRLLIFLTLTLTIFISFLPLLNGGFSVWLVLGLIGFNLGGFYSLSRAFLTFLAPSNQRNAVFSVFTIFRRFASVVGPLVWGITLLLLKNVDVATRYRLAIFPLVALLIVGFIFFLKIPNSKPNQLET